VPKVKRKPDVEIDPSDRDFVMARLLAARASATAAIAAIDDAGQLFVNPDQDKKGKERTELVGEALEALGAATRAVEMAEQTIHQVDFQECEPWDDDGEEVDDEDEDDDEEEDDDDGDD
jgi:hypothetical protein